MTENGNSKVKKLMEKVRNKLNKAAVAGALEATALTGTGCAGSDNKQADSEGEKIENVQKYDEDTTLADEKIRNDTLVLEREVTSKKASLTNNKDSVQLSMGVSEIRQIGSEKDGFKNDTVTHKMETKISYEEARRLGIIPGRREK